MKILLGPAGSLAKSTIEGIKVVHDLGLGAMEVAFTHGVHMGIDLAKRIAQENEKYGIALSIHAPYYINLASEDKIKVKESMQRILDSCERGHHMGAKRIILHTAYYGKFTKDETYIKVSSQIGTLFDTVKENGWNVDLLPETMGKISQFGDFDELIRLSLDTGCNICIDIGHLYARFQGIINFKELFDKLGKLKRKEFHFHFSGIEYGPKGERNHIVLNGNPSFKSFAKELLKRKISAIIISESPITWRDSLKMKKILEDLGYKFD